ncbi:MAG: bis(5'-nucleosyl)-tetraphosphatase (symmetrical) YqeK [Porcipelethomonas sp.]
MYSVDEIKLLLKKRLSKKRLNHSLNVADAAMRLAEKYGGEPEKAYLAGLIHDICKEIPADEQEELMLKGNMKLSGAELSSKALWHGPAAAYYIKAELGIDDSDIINAVRYHTVGRAGMSQLEEIVYMADLISEERDYKDADKMRKLAFSDFEKAMYEAVCYSVTSVIKKHGYIPECTVDLYNQYTYLYGVRRKNKEKNDVKK